MDAKNAAKAQVMYECWLRQAEKNQKKNKKMSSCMSSFYGAMAMVEVLFTTLSKKKERSLKKKVSKKAIRTKYFMAFFDFGSSKLSKKAQISVESALGFAISKKSNSIAVTGHTDTVGSKKANKALSKKRVASGSGDVLRRRVLT